MATTSLWRVHGWLGRLVVYVENPGKTENPKYFEKPGMSEHQAQGLEDVIEYAVSARKTVRRTDEAAPAERRFVSGVNCTPVMARDSMMRVKREFDKTGGVVAYHGYQSFSREDLQAGLTPETAHEIGVKLARQLWGERYQVLVATHLDKESHLHNHFVINTVSHIDGRKFHRTEKDYYDMQKASDALCREYGLSFIEEPQRGKSKHYAEWNAEREGRQTWRGLVKADVDAVIRQSMTERQFFENLRKAGYEIKVGKDISVRPPGKERFVRLFRNFGEDYTIEGIRRRILAQSRPERRVIPPDTLPKRIRLIGTIHKARRLTGLRALYFYYLYRMGVLPRKRQPNPKKVYFLFREDIRHMQDMAREIRLLAKHGIDTADRLAAHKDGANERIAALSADRKRLRSQTRSIRDESKLIEAKTEISALTAQITELRKEVKACENIESRSVEMKEKFRRANEAERQEQEKSKTREMMKDEPFRRRR
jgi:hypothetical protein